MPRLSACLVLVAALLAFGTPAAAPADGPAAHVAKKCKKKHKKKCKKKPKVFKPRHYEGTITSTNPSAPSTSSLSMTVHRSDCQPVTGGKAKRGICLTATFAGEYPTSCTKNGQTLSGGGPSGTVTADYLLPGSGTGQLTFHQDPDPSVSQDTIELTNKYKVTATAVTGTAEIHMVFQNSDGPMICDGSATFDLKRSD